MRSIVSKSDPNKVKTGSLWGKGVLRPPDPNKVDPNTPFFLRSCDPNYIKMWSRKRAKMVTFPLVGACFELNILVSIHLSSDLRRVLFLGWPLLYILGSILSSLSKSVEIGPKQRQKWQVVKSLLKQGILSLKYSCFVSKKWLLTVSCIVGLVGRSKRWKLIKVSKIGVKWPMHVHKMTSLSMLIATLMSPKVKTSKKSPPALLVSEFDPKNGPRPVLVWLLDPKQTLNVSKRAPLGVSPH